MDDGEIGYVGRFRVEDGERGGAASADLYGLCQPLTRWLLKQETSESKNYYKRHYVAAMEAGDSAR